MQEMEMSRYYLLQYPLLKLADDDVVVDALTKRTELSRLRINGHARP